MLIDGFDISGFGAADIALPPVLSVPCLMLSLPPSGLDAKQNRLRGILTIVAIIFMPQTLIAGWYGMNFVYMPELHSCLAYPIVIAVSIAIVVGCVWYFKKKTQSHAPAGRRSAGITLRWFKSTLFRYFRKHFCPPGRSVFCCPATGSVVE